MNHCCPMMRDNVESTCPIHEHRWECPDCLIDYNGKQYKILIHDGGSSGVEIWHCPWCGTRLPFVSQGAST